MFLPGYVYIYIWHCPINCLFDPYEKEAHPGEQNNRSESRAVQESTRSQPGSHSASQPFSQPAGHPASSFGRAAGQLTSQPARAQRFRAQSGSKVCPVWFPRADASDAKPSRPGKRKNGSQSRAVQESPRSQPASRPFSQPGSHPASRSVRLAGAGQPASQDPKQPGLNRGPKSARMFFPVWRPRAGTPDTSWTDSTSKMAPKRAYPGKKKGSQSRTVQENPRSQLASYAASHSASQQLRPAGRPASQP